MRRERQARNPRFISPELVIVQIKLQRLYFAETEEEAVAALAELEAVLPVRDEKNLGELVAKPPTALKV